MKIIHCADIHLGSKMDSKLPREKADERRRELRSALTNMAEYAANNGVSVILLAGDVFDSNRPFKKDKEFFYSVVRNNPQIDFLYLRGNHDSLESYTETDLANLKCFSDAWQYYDYGGTVIAGIELSAANCTSLYSTLRLERDKLNIVMLHGTAGDASGKDKINLTKLRNKNIDYLALGHLHRHDGFCRLDERGVYGYAGCLEGRGYDEAGEKGFVLLDADGKLTAQYVPFSKRTVHIYNVDISKTEDDYAAYRLVRQTLDCPKSDIVRVVLCGEIGYDNGGLAAELQKRLAAENYYWMDVKDETLRRIDYAAFEGDISIRGEFVRTVLAESALSPERQGSIIATGLKALDGREIET